MAFSGAMVKKAADQTGADYNLGAEPFGVVVGWDTEVYDTDGWHDTGSNTSRFTVPSGVSYVRMTANLRFNGTITGSVAVFVWVMKNGDTNTATRHINLPICMEDVSDGFSTIRLPNLVSGPIAVTPGDYLELMLFTKNDDSVTVEALSWCAIEAIANFSGCLVKKSADETAADYGTADVALTWDTEAFDVGGWHDTGSNTSRLTVPSGVSYARLSGCVTVTSLAAGTDVQIWVTKNGDNAAATRHINLPYVLEDSDEAARHLNFMSCPLAVSAGDYFELRLLTAGDASVTVEDYSWFAIEKIA